MKGKALVHFLWWATHDGQAMGSPQSPNLKQYQALEAASKMTAIELAPLAVKNGTATLDYVLPRQGVTLLVVE